jgi:type III pantothenate kinase
MVERMAKEMNTHPRVIATGGLAPLISGLSSTIEQVEPSLTLDGLKLISNELQMD